MTRYERTDFGTVQRVITEAKHPARAKESEMPPDLSDDDNAPRGHYIFSGLNTLPLKESKEAARPVYAPRDTDIPPDLT